MRVRVASDGKLPIRGFDLHLKSNAREQVVDRAGSFEVTCRGNTIALSPGGVWESPLRVESPSGVIHLGGRPYREAIWIHAGPQGCIAINQVDLERYLKGLLNAEFSAKWNESAVDAQAIAARSYALWKIQNARSHGLIYDLEATVEDQVYDGFASEDALASRSVERTRGKYLVPRSRPNEPLQAYYHSTCGGRTASAKSVWGIDVAGFPPNGVACGACGNSPRSHWKYDLDHLEAEALFKKELGLPGAWTLRSITAGALDPTGRVTTVQTKWNDPLRIQVRILPATRFRALVGPAKVRSTSFRIAVLRGPGEARAFRFDGAGNGHGVGLCQWGAKTLGEQGSSAERILSRYYPGAVLKKGW